MIAVQILLIVALIAWMLVRRMMGQPLRQRRLVVIPMLLVIYGVVQLAGTHLSITDLVLLVVESAVSLGIGALRGLTIHVYVRDGYLWMRYRWTTLGLWLVSVAVRVGFLLAGEAVGARLGSTPSLLIGLGTALLGEALILAPRARTTGAPYAPRASRRGTQAPAGR